MIVTNGMEVSSKPVLYFEFFVSRGSIVLDRNTWNLVTLQTIDCILKYNETTSRQDLIWPWVRSCFLHPFKGIDSVTLANFLLQ